MDTTPMNEHPIFRMNEQAALEGLSTLRALARRLVQDNHEAEDIAHAALDATAKRGAEISDPEVYARGVVRNQALQSRRARSRRRFHEAQGAAARPEVTEETPDKVLERVEVMRIVLQEVESLPAGQGRAIALRYLEELPVDEIAEVLGTQPSTVRSQISRGLEAVRARIDRRFGGRDSWSLVLAPWALDPAFLADAGTDGLAATSPGAAPAMAVGGGAFTTTLLMLKLGLLLAPIVGALLWFSSPDETSSHTASAAAVQAQEGAPLAGEPEAVAASTARRIAASENSEAAPAKPLPFAGRLLDREGRPAIGVRVTGTSLSGEAKGTEVSAETDSDGSFGAAETLPAGDVLLRFEDSGTGAPFAVASRPLAFPFSGDLETEIPPAIVVEFSGTEPPAGAKIFASPVPAETFGPAPVVGDEPRYVRFDPFLGDSTEELRFEVEGGYLSGLAEFSPEVQGREVPLLVRLEAGGVARFVLDGVEPFSQLAVQLERQAAPKGTALAMAYDGKVALAEFLMPGPYSWTFDFGGVQQAGELEIVAGATAEVRVGSPASLLAQRAELLIDASAVPAEDLSTWEFWMGDSESPFSILQPTIQPTGSPGSGLWLLSVDALPPGNWIAGAQPRVGYEFSAEFVALKSGETVGPLFVTKGADSKEINLRIVDETTDKLVKKAKLWVVQGLTGEPAPGSGGIYRNVTIAGGPGTAVYAYAAGYDVQRLDLSAASVSDDLEVRLRPGNRTRVFVIDASGPTWAEGVSVTIDGVEAGRTDAQGEFWFDASDPPEKIVLGKGQSDVHVTMDPFQAGIAGKLTTPGYPFLIERR